MSSEVVFGLFTVGGVVLTLLISLMTGAFVAGKHSNRISSLEARQKQTEAEARAAQTSAAQTSAEIAGLKATLIALDGAVHDGFRRMDLTIQGLFPRRQRRQGDDV